MLCTKIIDKTGRIFYRHEVWEDANNGLYNVGTCEDKTIKSFELLSNVEIFWDTMCQMRIDWPFAFQFNVSNKTQNRRAWLGQAACCYNHGAEFNLTIDAWQKLSTEQQNAANQCANNMINLFEKEEMNVKDTIRNERSYRCTATYLMDF